MLQKKVNQIFIINMLLHKYFSQHAYVLAVSFPTAKFIKVSGKRTAIRQSL